MLAFAAITISGKAFNLSNEIIDLMLGNKFLWTKTKKVT